MYLTLKKKLLSVTPPGFLYKFEFLLRWLLSLFYIGNAVICSICYHKFSSFIELKNGEKLCPRCGSLGRHRRLWLIISNEIKLNKTDRILDFSPSRAMQRKLKKIYPDYLSSNYEENKFVDKRYDITAIPEPENSFQLIICYHILEHIEQDSKAISELYRILKKNGMALVQTPFKDGDIYENVHIVGPEERLVHFGQEDHVRVYSVSGLKERLETTGFNVKILEYKEDEKNKFGFKPLEQVLLCMK